MSELYVGVDVSKEQLDVASSDGVVLRVSNDDRGYPVLLKQFEQSPPTLVLMEATGGLERALAVELSAAGIALRIAARSAIVTNPVLPDAPGAALASEASERRAGQCL